MDNPKTPQLPDKKQIDHIVSINVSGFKSLNNEQRLEIRPLTVLAGANSSGKSSAMQPLLLLKQTLEASYDPGAILINGPNVKATSADQLLSRVLNKKPSNYFSIGMEGTKGWKVNLVFKKQAGKGLTIHEMKYTLATDHVTLREGMTHQEIMSTLPNNLRMFYDGLTAEKKPEWTVKRDRFFLFTTFLQVQPEFERLIFLGASPISNVDALLRGIIHLPGLRGNPERTYPVTAVGNTFPGLFQDYVASIVRHWKDSSDERLDSLGRALETLGLTWKVDATQVNDTQVELKVGRLVHGERGGAYDLVSVADVGFGISQTLPVIVALLAAEKGQMVYLEQPEIHLHPNAQLKLAKVIKDAVKRGVIVIAETHSSILLQGIQSLVVEGKLTKEMVKLHWFERDEEGLTKVTSADLDDDGAFGDWPIDFADVALEAERQFLDAGLHK